MDKKIGEGVIEISGSFKGDMLVLDDSPLRLDIFRSALNNVYNITTAQTAKEAIDFLAKQDFHFICLDHDLGGNPPEYYGQDCDPNHVNTGSEVARWMKANPKPYLVMIHSRNPIGVKAISDILDTIPESSYKVIPFDELSNRWGVGTAW